MKNIHSSDLAKELALLLLKKQRNDSRNKQYATAKTILYRLGAGVILTGALLSPGGQTIKLKKFMDEGINQEWKQFNPYYLKQSLSRMKKQKLITVQNSAGSEFVSLTEKGSDKVIKDAFKELKIQKRLRWDHRWRILIYDIPQSRKSTQEHVRKTLKHLGFLQIQKSTYLTPYPCSEELHLVRKYYLLNSEIIHFIAEKIEDDKPYKEYFGLS